MSIKAQIYSAYNVVTADASHPFPSSTLKDPVYHGTSVSFNEFQKKKSTRYVLFDEIHVDVQGFFFAEDIHEAKSYVGGKGWVVECYVDLKKPLLDPRKHKHLGVDKLPEALEKDVVEILSEAIEGTGDDRKITLMLTTVYPDNPKYEDSDWIYEMISSGGLFWDIMDNPKVVKKMQALGYDGTFVHEDNHDNGRSIFVPNEKQIKIVKWLDAIEEEEE